MRVARAVLPLILLVAACGSMTPQELESALRTNARTTVSEPKLTLGSPYDAETTEVYAAVIRTENARVRRLFAAESSPPARFYLVPTATAEGTESWTHASAGGLQGVAFAEDFVFVFVRRPGTDAMPIVSAAIGAATARHELVHLYARRDELVGSPWFNEGLALEIESMRAADDGLHAHVFPSALLIARRSFENGVVRELITWRRSDDLAHEDVEFMYRRSHALMRFLLERADAPDVPEGARRVLALDDEEIVGLEPEWGRWLAAQDALSAIAVGVRSSDDAERKHAASLLPVLAEEGAPELRTRAADELAVRLLSDRACARAAATFLLFFRANALTADDVELLARSGDRVRALTGLALRARRGEPVDEAAARRLWDAATEQERRLLTAHASLIPGLRD